ncbi:MAG: DUF6913 domain-containing protein [Bacteroidales bacterium]
MNILKNIRLKAGNWLLRRRFKKVKRNKVVHNLETANTAGVLFTAGENSNFEIINEFLSFLSEKDIKVFALGYIHSKHIPEDLQKHQKINFVLKQDFTFFYKPKKPVIESFIEKEFDLLIDISMKNYFPVKLINNLSKAKFKVGNENNIDKDYDLMIALKKHQGLRFFVEQIKHYLSKINLEKATI